MSNILKRLFHDILGWHTPTYIYSTNGISIKSRCRICGRNILQDSQGNWFTF